MPRNRHNLKLNLQKFEYLISSGVHSRQLTYRSLQLDVVFENNCLGHILWSEGTLARPPNNRERQIVLGSEPLVEKTVMPDLEITCSECNTPFIFSEREQEYYRERNLTHPKRCKACRDARRANFGGSRGPGGERQRFDITCDQCGKTDSVPFKPSTGRPVLCSDCFSAGRTPQRN